MPPELVAVIVYIVLVSTMFGVPVISPVAVSKLSPFENAGLITHEPTAPPELEGEIVLIATSLVNVRSFCV